MSGQRVLAVWGEEFYELAAFLVREAGADADMLQSAGVVVKAEQERTHSGSLAFLVPAKTGHDTIAFALVFDLEHHALVGFIRSENRLGDDPVQPSALETMKPARGYAQFVGCWREVYRRLCR